MNLSEALAIAMERGWTLTQKGNLRTLTAPDGHVWVCVTSNDVWTVLRAEGIVEGGMNTDKTMMLEQYDLVTNMLSEAVFVGSHNHSSDLDRRE